MGFYLNKISIIFMQYYINNMSCKYCDIFNDKEQDELKLPYNEVLNGIMKLTTYMEMLYKRREVEIEKVTVKLVSSNNSLSSANDDLFQIKEALNESEEERKKVEAKFEKKKKEKSTLKKRYNDVQSLLIKHLKKGNQDTIEEVDTDSES